VVLFPVRVAEKVARLVVYHDAFIKRVVAEETIVPSLLLSAHIVGEEAVELGHRRGILRCGDGEARHGEGEGEDWGEGRGVSVPRVAFRMHGERGGVVYERRACG
jgi:hypothetical protein